MAINNREDANKYYQVINGLVDDYLDKWKIRPSNLKRYLQPGSERFYKFLERNKLNGIKGADVILKDVIEDRHSMESDGVITFEHFKFFESSEFKLNSLKECLYKGVEKASLDYEKAIADYLDTNLGDIDVVDSSKHLFKVNEWKGEDIKVVVYKKDDIEIIKYNMTEHFLSELRKMSVDVVEGVRINLSDLIKESLFEEQMGQLFEKDDLLTRTITKCLGGDFEFDGEYKGFLVWRS